MAMATLITRSAAQERGLKRYFTGEPCGRGHVAERSVANFTCSECKKLSDKSQYEKNPEKFIAKAAAWIVKNPARVAELAARPSSKAKAVARAGGWRLANKEKRFTYSRSYYAANKDKAYENWRTRRARKLSAEGSFSRSDIRRLHVLQRGKCANCTKPIPLGYHADHITPLSKGGSNWPANIQLLCPLCNSKKYNKDPIQWQQEQGRLL